ncbi:hypothetical protein DM01DRAFT_1026057 [Hesseltinella vesiculosa]|uniref:Uncharacterized protein n=1 Tax=Hesseltinella vesiculosa TaxID=101127 RepID=A0A1X2GKB1_9FUNG|nr:hypothetical protein DM01DRAFT_1026057 [Hesseltinella vesiculosa]
MSQQPAPADIIDAWLVEQKKKTKRSTVKPYDYFSFASSLDHLSEASINLFFKTTLSKAKDIDRPKLDFIEAAESKMNIRLNPMTRFGASYKTYWDNVRTAQEEQRKRKAREDIVENTCQLMESTSSDILDQQHCPKRRHMYDMTNARDDQDSLANEVDDKSSTITTISDLSDIALACNLRFEECFRFPMAIVDIFIYSF